jgi:hypothetical protein
VGFNMTDQSLIRFSFLHSSDTGGKKWEYVESIHQLFIDFRRGDPIIHLRRK